MFFTTSTLIRRLSLFLVQILISTYFLKPLWLIQCPTPCPIMSCKPTTTTPKSQERESLKVLSWLLSSQASQVPVLLCTDLVSAAIHYPSSPGPLTADPEQLPALNEPHPDPFSDSQGLLKGNLITMIANLNFFVPQTLVVHLTYSFPFFPSLIFLYLSSVNSKCTKLITISDS